MKPGQTTPEGDRVGWPTAVSVGLAFLMLGVLPVMVHLLDPTPSEHYEGIHYALVPVDEAPKPTVYPSTVFGGRLRFHDVEAQSREFIGYYHSIELTPEQQTIKEQVLGSIPAPCCERSSALTCCCPCNLSKTIWGLSNLVLTRFNGNADELRAAVYSWTSFTNPNGYGGAACFRGGCGRSFHSDGCGGMNESQLET